jgi:hypothetical protein
MAGFHLSARISAGRDALVIKVHHAAAALKRPCLGIHQTFCLCFAKRKRDKKEDREIDLVHGASKQGYTSPAVILPVLQALICRMVAMRSLTTPIDRYLYDELIEIGPAPRIHEPS